MYDCMIVLKVMKSAENLVNVKFFNIKLFLAFIEKKTV